MHPTTEDLGAAFARLRQSLLNYLLRRIPDPSQADDLLQDVFVKALASQQAGRRIDNLTGWLYAATRTTLADHYRLTGRPVEMLDDDIPSAEVDDLRMHQELSSCLQPLVEQLAPLYRDTLIATDFQGATMRSLAETQGVSTSAIKSRVARARVMLKERLLTCCQVEISGGFVSDYQQITPYECCEKGA